MGAGLIGPYAGFESDGPPQLSESERTAFKLRFHLAYGHWLWNALEQATGKTLTLEFVEPGGEFHWAGVIQSLQSLLHAAKDQSAVLILQDDDPEEALSVILATPEGRHYEFTRESKIIRIYEANLGVVKAALGAEHEPLHLFSFIIEADEVPA